MTDLAYLVAEVEGIESKARAALDNPAPFSMRRSLRDIADTAAYVSRKLGELAEAGQIQCHSCRTLFRADAIRDWPACPACGKSWMDPLDSDDPQVQEFLLGEQLSEDAIAQVRGR